MNIMYKIDKNKHCYNCKFIKFWNGYGSCKFNNRNVLVNESKVCIEWKKNETNSN